MLVSGFGGGRGTIGVFSGGRGGIGRFLSHRRSISRLGSIVRKETFLPVDFLLGWNMDQLGLTHRHRLLPTLLPLDVLTVSPGGCHTVGRVLHLQRESGDQDNNNNRQQVPTVQVKVCVVSVLLTNSGSWYHSSS